MFLNPRARPLLEVWAGIAVLYHSLFASWGWPTLGKELMGLRVVGEDGGPLPFWRALLRTAGYFASSVFALGFLWALRDPEGRAWHDKLAGSRVLAADPPPEAVSLAGGAVCLAFFAGTFLWQNFGAPRYYRLKTVASARLSLESVLTLQDIHYRIFKSYSSSFAQLSRLSTDPPAYLRLMNAQFDPAEGVRIELAPGGRSYTVTAYARDLKKTRVVLKGPARRP